MAVVRSAPTRQYLASQLGQVPQQIRASQNVGFILCDDFFTCSISAFLEVISPARSGNPLVFPIAFWIHDRAADVDPLAADNDFAILPDDSITFVNVMP